MSAAVVAALAWVPAGCQDNQGQIISTLQQELTAAQQENQELTRKMEIERRHALDLEAQVATLSRLGDDRIGKLFQVDRIELATLTGAANLDDRPGDDGVKVYIRPLDREGHVLKAAGEITVEIIDAGQPGSPRSLGVCSYTEPDELRKLWYGGMMTNHYTIICPWDPAAGPPSASDVEIKVTFYDFLTGKRLTASRTVAVSPAAGAAANPA